MFDENAFMFQRKKCFQEIDLDHVRLKDFSHRGKSENILRIGFS